MTLSGLAALPRRHPVWSTLFVALVLLVVLFDWNWFRAPLERYLSQKTQRTFRISDLHVKLGLTPTIRLRDVYFSNADWSNETAMATIKEVEFSVSLRDLPEKILLPRVALTQPELVFERLKDDRKNWVLSAPSDTAPTKLRISTLSVDQGTLRYLDHGEPFQIKVQVGTFDPAVQDQVKDADAKPVSNRYTTRYVFDGKYHGASFSGNALTGEVLSFQESGVLFPLKGDLKAGTTRLRVEGTMADVANVSGIDVQLRIEGQTLANLYPFLLLPLPASPPYKLQGRLTLKGHHFTIEKLQGQIGSTDVYGSAGYVAREPRPLLTADLHSKLLNINDLGPLIGVQTKESVGKPKATQAETATRQAAVSKQRADDPSHILPSGSFDGSRLQKVDAEVDYDAAQVKASIALPLESLRASVRLKDSVLKLMPLDFGFAGGTIASNITLDARQPTLKTDAKVDFRGIRVDRLVPADKSKIAQGAGLLGASIQLQGAGNSIADAAAKATGRVSATVSNGRVSNLLDAISGLNGGKVLSLLLAGDKTIRVNCGGMVFDVKNGKGTASLFVIDTEQTQILGSGGFDLAQERFELTITPKPKRVGILSLRTPVRVFGSFNKPDYSIEKGPLLVRAGSVVALALVAPIAALLPLVETGPGESSDCGRVETKTVEAKKQATAPRTGKRPVPAKSN